VPAWCSGSIAVSKTKTARTVLYRLTHLRPRCGRDHGVYADGPPSRLAQSRAPRPLLFTGDVLGNACPSGPRSHGLSRALACPY
jgi:hypothetical protein